MSGATEHLYAGCPDLIGEIGGVKIIADFKTSNAPYSELSSLKRVTVLGFGGFQKVSEVCSTNGGLPSCIV